jgi:hypothetical protein
MMKREIRLLGAVFLCGCLMVFGSVGSAKALIDFEYFKTNYPGPPDMYDLIEVIPSGNYEGLDWNQPNPWVPDPPSGTPNWQVNIYGSDELVPFAGAGGSDTWIKGFAYKHPNRDAAGVNDFAKIGIIEVPFYFHSMKLRVREYDTNGAEDGGLGWNDPNGDDGNDGVDDRFLKNIMIQFNLGNGYQKRIKVDLAPDPDSIDWVPIAAGDVSLGWEGWQKNPDTGVLEQVDSDPLLATHEINAVKFLGDGPQPPEILRVDRFGLDDLDITLVPIPGAVWLLGSLLIGFLGFKRARKTV